MSYAGNPYQSPDFTIAAHAAADERADFITKTYAHLFGAIGLFVILEVILLNLPITDDLARLMMGRQYSWLVVLGLFMVVSWVAQSWAQSSVSLGKQYMGLGLYVAHPVTTNRKRTRPIIQHLFLGLIMFSPGYSLF